MWPCRTRRSMSPMETSRSTSGPRSSPAATSPPPSPMRFADTSTSRRARAKASTRSPSAWASAPGRKVRFTAVLVGEWIDTRDERVEHYRVYRGRTGKYVLHVEREPGVLDGRCRGQAGRMARLPGHRRRPLRQLARGVDPRGRRRPSTSSATRSRPSSSRWSRAPRGSRPWRSWTSEAGAAAAPSDGTVRDDGAGRLALGDPASAACASRTASRSSSTASTSRSPRARCSRCSGPTAPARRRRSTSSRR